MVNSLPSSPSGSMPVATTQHPLAVVVHTTNASADEGQHGMNYQVGDHGGF